MSKNRLIYLLFTLPLLMIVYSGQNMRAEEKNHSAIENGSILEITEEQNGGIVAMIVHDTLSIQIEGNPTTGFIWEPENLNKNLLELVGDPKFTPNSHLKGGNGIFTFKFKALKAGVTHLRLIYHRSFEKDTPSERIFDVILDIQ